MHTRSKVVRHAPQEHAPPTANSDGDDDSVQHAVDELNRMLGKRKRECHVAPEVYQCEGCRKVFVMPPVPKYCEPDSEGDTRKPFCAQCTAYCVACDEHYPVTLMHLHEKCVCQFCHGNLDPRRYQTHRASMLDGAFYRCCGACWRKLPKCDWCKHIALPVGAADADRKVSDGNHGTLVCCEDCWDDARYCRRCDQHYMTERSCEHLQQYDERQNNVQRKFNERVASGAFLNTGETTSESESESESE